MRRRLPIALTSLAAALAATAALVLPAAGDETLTTGEAISLARSAFAGLAPETPGSPAAPADLPTRAPGAHVVGQAELTDSEFSAALTLTDDADVCLTVDGASTCQPAEDAAVHGLFIAGADCDPDAVTVWGAVPDGVEDVEALGTDAPASATAEPDGSVLLTFDGDELDGLELDNAEVAPLTLDSLCDASVAP